MQPKRILVSRQDHVAEITLNRPDVHNAFDAALIQELTDAFRELGMDSQSRLIVLAGKGKSFCAGGDIEWMRASVELSKEANKKDALTLHRLFETIYRCPKPVLAKVQGAAFGGGVGLAAVADGVVAASDAVFSLSETRLGILPAVIGPYLLRKIGVANLRAYGLSAKRFGALDALRMGLVQEVAAPSELDRVCGTWVEEFLQNGPEAMATLKAITEVIENESLSEAAKTTTRTISNARTGKEGQEGLRAFLEKRRPTWRVK